MDRSRVEERSRPPLRQMKRAARMTRPMRARPPTTPPTIDGVVDEALTGADVEIGVECVEEVVDLGKDVGFGSGPCPVDSRLDGEECVDNATGGGVA